MSNGSCRLGTLLEDPRVLEIVGMLGTPYHWGKGDPSTPWPSDEYDCSGFAQGVLVQLRLLPPSAPDRDAFSLAMVCNPIDPDTARIGDLAFYGLAGRVSHVMVCIGGGWVVGARGGRRSTRGDDRGAYVDIKKLKYRADLIVVGRIKPEVSNGSYSI